MCLFDRLSEGFCCERVFNDTALRMCDMLRMGTDSPTFPDEFSENVPVNISEQDIKDLLVYFEKNEYEAASESVESSQIMKCALELLKRDYKFMVLNNKNGNICPTYPSHLPIITEDKNVDDYNDTYSFTAEELYTMFLKSKDARCRNRTVMPVIFYKNRYVCRSATISCGCEMFLKRGFSFFYRLFGYEAEDAVCRGACCDSDLTESERLKIEPPVVNNDVVPDNEDEQVESFFNSHNTLRGADIRVLKRFKVKGIVDLMVEKKKCKYGLKISSSEKVDRENRYLQFKIIGLPYPGCEHFSKFTENGFEARDLTFCWDPTFCDANLILPGSPPIETTLENEAFRHWDTVTLTQNYLKYILNYLEKSDDSILVHCISGWDRTPLFISLIRLSLWADGLIHQNLDEYQILYFCIAFDWFLFSHRLKTRISKKEEIFFFCFYMLKFIEDDEYSLASLNTSGSEDESNGNPSGSSLLDVGSNQGRKSLSPPSRKSPVQRTSPINVPDSVSGNSNNDWQLITETGSYSSQDLNLNPHSATSPSREGSLSPARHIGKRQPLTRRSRLQRVRKIFYKTYHKTIGHTTVGYTKQSFMSGIVRRITGY
ncbi:myotubularin-related protein 14 isoform X2 [Aethina tumida]|uniref:myotubularin-related protein 14 isoform X2 n=1 Tax=Aethina tumida TaxID=116153 RepID=UPI002147AA8A|nr:myotubularin-related protein 14 isoform X2 [Aethina tumida]